jgi:hypothetical protein
MKRNSRFTNKFVSWFTGTSINSILHPVFGNHQVTPNQIKYSSGEYKSRMFKCITESIQRGIITEQHIKNNS